MEGFNAYSVWRRERPRIPEKFRTEFSLNVRIIMLLWLMNNGHTGWMRKSGAWLCIITNNKYGHFWCGQKYENFGEDVALSPGDYVRKYS